MQAPKLLLASLATAAFCLPSAALPSETIALVEVAPVETAPTTAAFADVPADFAALLPADLSVVVMTRPIAELEGIALDMASKIMPEMAEMVNADAMLQMAGIDPAMIDHTKPLCFALGPISMDGEPQAYALIPTKDGEALRDLFAGMSGMPPEMVQLRTSGSYVGMTMGAIYPEAGKSRILGTVPAGLIGLSVDVESILDTFGPLIQMGMQMARMQLDTEMPQDMPMDVGAMLDSYFGLAEGAMDSMEEFRMSIDITDSRLDIRETFVVSEGSPMSNLASDKPSNLSKLLPLMRDDSISIVVGANMGEMMTKMAPFMDTMTGIYPAEMGEGLTASMAAFQDIYAKLGDGFVASGDFTDAGIEMSMFFDGTEFEGLLAAYKAALEQPFWGQLGMKYLETKTGKSGDVNLTRFIFEFDMEAMMASMGEELPESDLMDLQAMMVAMYGENLTITLAESGGIGAMVVGGGDDLMTEALGRIAAGGSAPRDFALLADLAARSNPFMSYSLDFGDILASVMPLVSNAMGAPPFPMDAIEGLTLPLNFYFGASKTEWTGGMMVDLVQAAEFAQRMQELEK